MTPTASTCRGGESSFRVSAGPLLFLLRTRDVSCACSAAATEACPTIFLPLLGVNFLLSKSRVEKSRSKPTGDNEVAVQSGLRLLEADKIRGGKVRAFESVFRGRLPLYMEALFSYCG